MAIALPDGPPSRPRSRRRLWMGFSLLLFAVGLTSYCIVVLTYSGLGTLSAGSSPPEEKPSQHGHDDGKLQHDSSHPVEKPEPTDRDPFTLHPEQHIHRQPQTIRRHWNVTKEARRPDGVLRDVYLINGQFPGPTIEARPGDHLEVTVVNSIANDTEDGLAIHWHGMLMSGSNEMDGAVGVTQCTVDEHKSFTYKFQIAEHQHGTFWYHAHSAVKRADGLYGGLVVHKSAPDAAEADSSLHGYDSEKLLLIGDWYHFAAEQVLAQYKSFLNFGAEPVADSLLINGVGSYNCSQARPGKPVDCVDTERQPVHVSGDEAVRLRIVNVGASAGFSFELDNAALQLITVDGGAPVSSSTPQAPTLGVVYPGERIDALLLPNHASDEKRHDDMNMKIILDPELMPIMNPALTRIQSIPITRQPTTKNTNRSSSPRKTTREKVDVFNLASAQGPSVSALPPPAETAVLYTSLAQNSYKEDEPWGELNHTSFVWRDPHAKPLLAMEKQTWENGTEQANPLRTFRVPQFEAGEERWMELVVNNIDDRGHPFHLHGYEFYVISSQQQTNLGKPYNPHDAEQHAEAQKLFNEATPLRRDTVYVRAQGYVVLRIRLNNPGLWLMHCHVLWHQAVGMGLVMQVGNVTDEAASRAAESCTL